MLNKEEFFQTYPSINIDEFNESLMDWEELLEIYKDYKNSIEEFSDQAEFIFKKIIGFKNVHSCKFRVKDPEHLIEKIIRKNLVSLEKITLKNYREKLHDLIGLRAIHLYKEDWESIDLQIRKRWGDRLHGKPVANIREGDSPEFIKLFEDAGGQIRKHQYGYRSIHYILTFNSDNQNKFYAELQVRTIFEEGWSEIDHDIRYPYQQENPLYKEYLGILNRLAGASDEMATMLKFLDKDQNEKVNLINELTDQLNLQIEVDQKRIQAIDLLKNNLVKLALPHEIEEELNHFLSKVQEDDFEEISLTIEAPLSIWSRFKNRIRKIWRAFSS
jgi:ppGpp synthetase/RelA/SpoT-type nucleotidyltranferase